MSASSAASMVRTVGRGAALRAPRRVTAEIASNQEPTRPLGYGRGSKLPYNPSLATSDGNAPDGNVPDVNDRSTRRRPNESSRSALTAAVLDRRRQQDSDNNSPPRHRNRQSFDHKTDGNVFSDIWQNNESNGAKREAAAAARERARAEWFAAAEKRPQLASIESQVRSDRLSGDASRPFAWGNLSGSVDHLPQDHWASTYLRGAARSLESNAALSANQKRIMLTQLMQSLATLSRSESQSNPK